MTSLPPPTHLFFLLGADNTRRQRLIIRKYLPRVSSTLAWCKPPPLRWGPQLILTIFISFYFFLEHPLAMNLLTRGGDCVPLPYGFIPVSSSWSLLCILKNIVILTQPRMQKSVIITVKLGVKGKEGIA